VPALKRIEDLFARPGRLRPSRAVEIVSDGRLLTVRRVVERVTADYEYRLARGETIEIAEAGWLVSAGETCESVLPTGYTQTVAVPRGCGDVMVVRNRRSGDRFTPLGMEVEKKLSDFFIDRKIPKYIRDTLPLVLIDGRIAWIAGTEISDDFRLGRGETERLVLCASRLGDDR